MRMLSAIGRLVCVGSRVNSSARSRSVALMTSSLIASWSDSTSGEGCRQVVTQQLQLQGHRTQCLEGVFVYVGSDPRPLSVLGLEEPDEEALVPCRHCP